MGRKRALETLDVEPETEYTKKAENKVENETGELAENIVQSDAMLPRRRRIREVSDELGSGKSMNGLPIVTLGYDEQINEVTNDCDYVSPIANPLLGGKLLQRSLKLIKKAVIYERETKEIFRTQKNNAIPDNMLGKKTKEITSASAPCQQFTEVKNSEVKCVFRGVQEVTKALRKGQRGIVFLASDVFPIDIVVHIPAMCEERDVAYAYVGSKRTIGAACRSKRPACVLMIGPPPSKLPPLSADACITMPESYINLLSKVTKGITKVHPWL